MAPSAAALPTSSSVREAQRGSVPSCADSRGSASRCASHRAVPDWAANGPQPDHPQRSKPRRLLTAVASCAASVQHLTFRDAR